MDQETKRLAVFESATAVFSQYGFRRTSMNDLAEAANISRPALYLMFDNKEDLFRQLATHRQAEAIDVAASRLAGDAAFDKRIIEAILAYEKVYYEPVSQSPHGAELMDVNLSIASADMLAGLDRLLSQIAASIEEAVTNGHADLSTTELAPRAFVDLLMSSIGGQKKTATSTDDFRRKVRNVTSIFLASITKKETS